jgi:hypothetical protein
LVITIIFKFLGDEFEELGIFGSGGDLDLMADDAALDFELVVSNIVLVSLC